MENKRLQEEDLGQVSGGKLESALPKGCREHLVTVENREMDKFTREELVDLLCNEMRLRGESVSPQDFEGVRGLYEVESILGYTPLMVHVRLLFAGSGKLFSINVLN